VTNSISYSHLQRTEKLTTGDVLVWSTLGSKASAEERHNKLDLAGGKTIKVLEIRFSSNSRRDAFAVDRSGDTNVSSWRWETRTPSCHNFLTVCAGFRLDFEPKYNLVSIKRI
jgi:hypothetical protein